MTQTQQTETEAPQTMVVHGRVYTLIAGSKPPHYLDVTNYVSVRGYPGTWSAHVSAYGPGATVMVGAAGDGATPEEALEALAPTQDAVEVLRVRLMGLVDAARGMRREEAAQ